jgi:ABC-type proline/glycine betaine transport system ATPase subunit
LHEQFLDIRSVEAVSTLLVTHDMREARKLSAYLVILKEGWVVQHGPTRAVIAAPENDYVKGLLESLE